MGCEQEALEGRVQRRSEVEQDSSGIVRLTKQVRAALHALLTRETRLAPHSHSLSLSDTHVTACFLLACAVLF